MRQRKDIDRLDLFLRRVVERLRHPHAGHEPGDIRLHVRVLERAFDDPAILLHDPQRPLRHALLHRIPSRRHNILSQRHAACRGKQAQRIATTAAPNAIQQKRRQTWHAPDEEKRQRGPRPSKNRRTEMRRSYRFAGFGNFRESRIEPSNEKIPRVRVLMPAGPMRQAD